MDSGRQWWVKVSESMEQYSKRDVAVMAYNQGAAMAGVETVHAFEEKAQTRITLARLEEVSAFKKNICPYCRWKPPCEGCTLCQNGSGFSPIDPES
jgi:MoaA/NifB/PqqE/SkfB family radical SAM enzyme